MYKNIMVLLLMLSLSACPYKEVYKTVTKEKEINGLKICPLRLVFTLHKKIAQCDVIFRIINPSDSVKEADFAKSYLINTRDTLPIEKIFPAFTATNLPSQNVFKINPQQDTIIGFTFKGLKESFGDTLKVVLRISGTVKNDFSYYKVK